MPGRVLAVLACRGALRGGAAGEALCAAVGLGGCRAVVACRWGRAEAFAWAGAGLARRWAGRGPLLPGLALGPRARGPLRSGAFAAGACAGAGAAGVAAGFSRGQGPGLGSALLAMVRFRGAARGPLPSWPALPGPGWPALGGAFAQRGPGCAVLHGPCCRGAAYRGQTTILQI